MSLASSFPSYTRAVMLLAMSILYGCDSDSGDSGPADFDVPPATPELAAQLLARATFGVSEQGISDVLRLGLEGWIDDQFRLQGPAHLDFVKANSNGSATAARHEVWWRDVVEGKDQLRQRVAYALSQIFVIADTGYTLSNSQYGVTAYYDMLRDNAFGHYRQLLESVSLSPVMGLYLSMLQNAKSDAAENTRPDENYAREVLQLFSIGLYQLNADGSEVQAGGKPLPAFTQADVETYARAFTGWNYKDAGDWNRPLFTGNNLIDPMVAFADYHDTNTKPLLGGVVTASGATAEQDMASAMDSIAGHPNVGPFIGKQLIQRLVTSNPTPAYVARVSAVFDDNGVGVRGDLQAVVKAILLDSEALNGHDSIANFGKLREPVLRISHVWRAFNVTRGADSDYGEYNTTSPHVQDLDALIGQAVLKSPSVFNFYRPTYTPLGVLRDEKVSAPETEIYTDNNILATTTRINSHIQRHFAGSTTPQDLRWSYIDLSKETELAQVPADLLEHLDLLLLSGGMSDDLKQILVEHMQALPATLEGRSVRARDTISLIVASPDYLVQL